MSDMPAAKILIVEDEGLTAMELQRKLKLAGYDVPTFAFSGKEAIKKAEEINPDLVLMDIFLKGKIDGIDAAEEIKKNMGVPIIFLTAHGDKKTQERAKSTEPFAYLLKPFDIGVLQHNIDQALYQHSIEKLGDNSGIDASNLPQQDVGTFVTDDKGIINFTNHKASLITQIEQKEAVGKNITEIFKIKSIHSNKEDSEEQVNPVECFFSDQSVQSKDLHGMAWLQTDSGSLKAIKYTISPVNGENNKFNGLSICFNDINLLKELDISMDSVDNVSEQFPQETAIFNEKGDIIQANSLFLKFFKAENLADLNINLFDNFGLSKNIEIKEYGNKNYESKFNPLKLDLNPNIQSKIENGLYLKLNTYNIPSKSGTSGYLVQVHEIEKMDNAKKSSLEGHSAKSKPKSDYAAIINSIDDIFFVIDPEFRCVHWNTATENLTGTTSEKALGRSIYEIFPGLKGSLTDKLYHDAFKLQKHMSIIEKSGNSLNKFVEIDAYPFKKGLAVLIKDVTSVKKSENELKEKQNLFKSLINTVNSLTCIFYENGSLFFANNSFKKYFSDSENFMRIFNEKEKNKLANFIKNSNESNNFSNSKSGSESNLEIKSSIKDNSSISWNINVFDGLSGNKTIFWASGHILKDLSENKNGSKSISSAIDNSSHEIKDANVNYKDFTKSKGFKVKFEEMNHRIKEAENREASLIKKNEKILEDMNKKIETLENDKNELNSKIKQFEISDKELKDKLKIQMELNESLSDLGQISDLNKENDSKESIEELKNSLMTYERQYKLLMEENKSLRENKSLLKKQANKIKKEYMVLEKEFKDQIKTQKDQIMKLRKANNSLSKDYMSLEKRAISFKDEFEERIRALEQEKKQETEKSNILEKQLKDTKKDLSESKS